MRARERAKLEKADVHGDDTGNTKKKKKEGKRRRKREDFPFSRLAGYGDHCVILVCNSRCMPAVLDAKRRLKEINRFTAR